MPGHPDLVYKTVETYAYYNRLDSRILSAFRAIAYVKAAVVDSVPDVLRRGYAEVFTNKLRGWSLPGENESLGSSQNNPVLTCYALIGGFHNLSCRQIVTIRDREHLKGDFGGKRACISKGMSYNWRQGSSTNTPPSAYRYSAVPTRRKIINTDL